jgi:hypothetical protein
VPHWTGACGSSRSWEVLFTQIASPAFDSHPDSSAYRKRSLDRIGVERFPGNGIDVDAWVFVPSTAFARPAPARSIHRSRRRVPQVRDDNLAEK